MDSEPDVLAKRLTELTGEFALFRLFISLSCLHSFVFISRICFKMILLNTVAFAVDHSLESNYCCMLLILLETNTAHNRLHCIYITVALDIVVCFIVVGCYIFVYILLASNLSCRESIQYCV